MHLVLTAISLLITAVAALALLTVLVGALAYLFTRCRRENQPVAIDFLAFFLLMAAGLVLNAVVLSLALCWSKITGNPHPPPPQYGSAA
jgi:hypothetical protein